MLCTCARGRHCSPVMAEEDKQGKAVSEGCSLEHERRCRGGAMTVKSDGGLNSAWERRRGRASSRARGKGTRCSGGGARPFIGGGEAATGKNGQSKCP
jgi:hypothetical protein